jgi:hypothetical protein
MEEISRGPSPQTKPPSRPLLLAAVAALWVALALFLVFVWPKPYRKAGAEHRINRLTGSAQSYDQGRRAWKPAKRRERNTQVTPPAASESPVGGGRSGGGTPTGSGARGEGWWYENKERRPAAKPSGEGEQWWYQDNGDKAESSEPSGGGDSDGWWHD